tara:strand:+ start:584 stop:844 length:261 start_codon:yes stop_codon:yes gene_type:complete
MALIEKTITDKIEVVGDFKHVQVRQDNLIVDDDTGEIKAKGNWHRYVLNPDDDISGQPADVAAVANAVWTDEVKAAWAAHKAEQEL